MKAIANIMKTLGVFCVFLGLATIESALVVIPIAFLATGGAIAFAGLSIEGSDYARASR